MKANVLPEATPSVLSQVGFRCIVRCGSGVSSCGVQVYLQVAFQALIPCFMMTKVASTLSVQPLAVAFQALIPCFMMTKVASTLSVQPLSSLAFLPLLAVFQVRCTPPHSSPLLPTPPHSSPLLSTPLLSSPLHSNPLHFTSSHSIPLTLLILSSQAPTPVQPTAPHSTPLHF
ncbi:unnamed protein product [Closterium sp. NIES-65]|nr:unnamed protein product [Closterium sp. NIES-65]